VNRGSRLNGMNGSSASLRLLLVPRELEATGVKRQ
jgi:hypothetical protein